MIISRTPFRMSFFGGGTDYPTWFREYGGSVLATSINKYCYITCRYLPPFFEHKTRIAYSRVEMVAENNGIVHPAVRGTLQHMKIQEGLEIHHDGDLPARTGLGSSSAFTVGLLHALYALKQTMPTKLQLAKEAIHIEQEVLKENVGCQDQISTAFGGLSKIDFLPNGEFVINPIILREERIRQLQDHLLLYFTGFSRIASDIAKEQISLIQTKKKELNTIYQMVNEALTLLTAKNNLEDFGKLLHESWQLKRTLSSKVSNSKIDEIYQTAIQAGALGGKILGAGGGGFLLLFARPEAHNQIHAKLNGLLKVPFRFENQGSQIIVYQPT